MSSSPKRNIFEESVKNFLTPIAQYLDDGAVSEVLVNGPSEIFVERSGKLVRTESRFRDDEELQAAVRNIAQSVGRRFDIAHPALDARLPDGSRVHAVMPPASRSGTALSIRKFSRSTLLLDDLVDRGSVSPTMAKFMHACVALGKNTIVSGGTGSGKTSLLNVLAGLIEDNSRVLVIEDSSELQIKCPHVIYFETVHGDEHKGIADLTIRDLVKSSLRLRPDRVIVGEVRGAEALDLINAMNTGHSGSMGTTHANSPGAALVRLETLALMGDTQIPQVALRAQIASAIEIVIQAKRYADGSRRVSEVAEVIGVDEKGNYHCATIFEYVQTGRGPNGEVLGEHRATKHVPTFKNELQLVWNSIKNYQKTSQAA